MLTIDLELLNSYPALYIGFSGGLDSMCLVHAISLIPSLKSKSIAVHINHQLHSDSSNWSLYCKIFCENIGISFKSIDVTVSQNAGLSIEEEARRSRYQAFETLIKKEQCLVLGHHINDQSETVLLQLLRGSGLDGLSAMPKLKNTNTMTIARPMLGLSKTFLTKYAKQHKLEAIEDPSNNDVRFKRNFLRLRAIPLLREEFKGLDKTLARSATHCQEHIETLELFLEPLYQQVIDADENLNLHKLKTHPFILQKQLLRKWFRKKQLRYPHANQLTSFLKSLINAPNDKQPSLVLDNFELKRFKHHLYCVKASTIKPISQIWHDVSEPIELKNNLGRLFFSHESCSKPISLPIKNSLKILYRTGGETILLHGKHRKVKKIFQEREIPPWERNITPLLYLDNTLIAIAGVCISDHFIPSSKESLTLHFQKGRVHAKIPRK